MGTKWLRWGGQLDSTVIDNTRGQHAGTTDGAQSFKHVELFIFTLEQLRDIKYSVIPVRPQRLPTVKYFPTVTV